MKDDEEEENKSNAKPEQFRYIDGKLHKLVEERWRGYADSIHITWDWIPVNGEQR